MVPFVKIGVVGPAGAAVYLHQQTTSRPPAGFQLATSRWATVAGTAISGAIRAVASVAAQVLGVALAG
jgi:hypothetical protein